MVRLEAAPEVRVRLNVRANPLYSPSGWFVIALCVVTFTSTALIFGFFYSWLLGVIIAIAAGWGLLSEVQSTRKLRGMLVLTSFVKGPNIGFEFHRDPVHNWHFGLSDDYGTLAGEKWASAEFPREEIERRFGTLGVLNATVAADELEHMMSTGCQQNPRLIGFLRA